MGWAGERAEDGIKRVDVQRGREGERDGGDAQRQRGGRFNARLITLREKIR